MCVFFLFFMIYLFYFFFVLRLLFLFPFSLTLIWIRQSSGSDESLAAGHQQHIRPHGPLVLRLGPGPSATVGGPVGSQQDGEVVHCGFFPSPPLPSCSSSSSASLLLVAAPLPSQPISSRLVRGAGYSAYILPSVACTPSLFFPPFRRFRMLDQNATEEKNSFLFKNCVCIFYTRAAPLQPRC